MSLIVWLPLNGDLKNQGLSNVIITNNGATVDNSGKIGKCYSFNNTYLSIPSPLSSSTTSFSICAWVNISSLANGYGPIYDSRTGSSGAGIVFWLTTSGFRLDDGSMWQPSCSLPTGSWIHVCWTRSPSNQSVYLNGSLVSNTTTVGNLSLINTTAWIGRDQNSGNTYHIKGKLNDVRIYDHCLTPQEVKEISKGLVIHYTLGSESVLPAITNYCSNSGAGGWNNSGGASRSGNDTTKGSPLGLPVYSITTTTAGEQCITFGNPDVTNLKGKQVTASCWIYIVGSTIYNSTPYLRSSKYDNAIASFKYEGNGSINTWPKNKWIRVSGTGTVASDETGAYFCNYIGNSGEVRYYTGWQVELYGEATPYIAPGTSRSPGIIYDSSGYCRNGTISGTLIPNSDTSRYKNCVRVTGTGKIVYPFPNLLQFTFSLWFKRDRVSLSNREMLGTGWYGLSMELNSDNTLTMRHYLTSGTWDVISTTKFSDTSKWYHIALTRNASGISKIYVNGVEDKSGTNANAINYTASTAELFTYADSYLFRGSMSDFRIYATALSADDVSDLYKLGALIS